MLVPTNEALAKIPSEDLLALSRDPATLKNILLYHIVSGLQVKNDFVFGRHFFLNSTNGHVIRVYRSAVRLGSSLVPIVFIWLGFFHRTPGGLVRKGNIISLSVVFYKRQCGTLGLPVEAISFVCLLFCGLSPCFVYVVPDKANLT